MGPTGPQWALSAPPRRPEPRHIAPMAVPKQEDTTTSWRRERGPSRRSTAHRLRPLINRQDRIESSTAPACSSADTISRSHTAPKIMRLRYERRAPCFVTYYTRRRPQRRENAWNPKFEDTQRTFTYPAVIYLRNYRLSRYLRRAVARLKNDLPKRAAVARLPPRHPAPNLAQQQMRSGGSTLPSQRPPHATSRVARAASIMGPNVRVRLLVCRGLASVRAWGKEL